MSSIEQFENSFLNFNQNSETSLLDKIFSDRATRWVILTVYDFYSKIFDKTNFPTTMFQEHFQAKNIWCEELYALIGSNPDKISLVYSFYNAGLIDNLPLNLSQNEFIGFIRDNPNQVLVILSEIELMEGMVYDERPYPFFTISFLKYIITKRLNIDLTTTEISQVLKNLETIPSSEISNKYYNITIELKNKFTFSFTFFRNLSQMDNILKINSFLNEINLLEVKLEELIKLKNNFKDILGKDYKNNYLSKELAQLIETHAQNKNLDYITNRNDFLQGNLTKLLIISAKQNNKSKIPPDLLEITDVYSLTSEESNLLIVFSDIFYIEFLLNIFDAEIEGIILNYGLNNDIHYFSKLMSIYDKIDKLEEYVEKITKLEEDADKIKKLKEDVDKIERIKFNLGIIEPSLLHYNDRQIKDILTIFRSNKLNN